MIENNLKYCREELEMTQTELGKLLGVKKATISNWENGYSIIPLKKLILFGNMFGYSLDYICKFTNENQKFEPISFHEKEIGNRLKIFRNSLHFSQQKFASQAHIPQSTYSHYEIGYKLITTMNLYSICKTYHISMDFLIGRTKEKVHN